MVNLLLVLLSAALLILSFPHFNLAWLAPVALTPLLIGVARQARPFRRFLLGWCAGIVYWFGVCYWIQNNLAVHAGTGEALGWALFALFCLTKAIHMGCFAMGAGVLMRRWWAIPSVAGLWVAIEVTHGSAGFAWLTLGNAGINMGIPMRLAPFTGVYGISFAFMMMSTALAVTLLRKGRLQLLWMAPLLLLPLAPSLPPAEPGREAALMLQPNLSESEEWTSQSLDQMERDLVTLTLENALVHTDQPPSLLVWPEVPAPFYYDPEYRFHEYVDTLARSANAYFVVGVVAHNETGAPLNSATLVSPAGMFVSRYDKVNLVPFGEFVPWPFRYLVDKISTEAGDFAAGKRVEVPLAGKHRIGTFICYESAFPNFVRRFADGGAEVLINISNDGWFGQTAARQQHLNLVRMRAAENRRWVLRSTNDGVTAVIDPAGRVRVTLESYQQGTLYANFSYVGEKTLYTRWGDWFAALSATIAILGLVSCVLE